MLGETITITHNAVARVLPRIREDNYSAEYLLRTTTDEFSVKVKHLTESAKAATEPFERHSVEYTHSVFATLTTPERQERISHVIRSRRSGDPATALLSAKALVGWLTDATLAKLIAWES